MSRGGPRFQLLVIAGQDGKCVGDCPFSQRANMFSKLVLNPEDIDVTPVSTVDKPGWFLKLYPDGKVPVLIDRTERNKIVPDSEEIVKYLSTLFSKPELVPSGFEGIPTAFFPKFAALMKNKDKDKDHQLRVELTAELGKLNSYIESRNSSTEYLMCDKLTEADCQVLPKLRHVQVAGRHYKNYEIPGEFSALNAYIKCGEESLVFRQTCPADEEFIWGWSKFFL
ncbi:CLIC2-like protein [Mya arenaria]|uniref:CLIC2-like protein n=1 Tax=Mya arenaria TaxID=6604 RepID=A0ABY7FQQ9_MYAAR|nr:chloride intracellular channel protein 2-like [Mya arenaria]XP_052776900.1 chloride intracellular channel protein 2-like [Mya arenaria]WAR23063.1 CLIC2-like protein [Mya arenaria]